MMKRRVVPQPKADQGDFRASAAKVGTARPVDAGDEPVAERPRLPFRPLRNGLPVFRPYVYRGTGVDIYEHLYKDEPLVREPREDKVA